MKYEATVKINFHGGIISPGELYNILVAAGKAGVATVSFGLRQQLLIGINFEYLDALAAELNKLGIEFEINNDHHPGIISSYPAAEVFITQTWLSEGVYKDILDTIDYRPTLKINISDSNQCFTPILTGNINWIADPDAQHFWHLIVRFPKTNTIYEWNKMVYTNDVARMSQEVEWLILKHKADFFDNAAPDGEKLFQHIDTEKYITRTAEKPVKLPSFNLPYYEGLNRYNNKYWLGIYRRDELFNIAFLKEICALCLETKIGQICSTPWKSIIVKGIDEKDKLKWNRLLEQFHINMRHAANELNFQVEDNCEAGLQLKSHLVKKLNDDDIRTFGICIGIKTRRKSEVFSSILVRRKPLLRFGKFELFYVYDILCAQNFNPNERTGFVFSRNNPKFLLAEQLRRSVISFYNSRLNNLVTGEKEKGLKVSVEKNNTPATLYQCRHCGSVYDETLGDPERNIPTGTGFEQLANDYTCATCEAPKSEFIKTNKEKVWLEAV
ncbi:MAG: rubredoxin [Agriterribacter sp.]